MSGLPLPYCPVSAETQSEVTREPEVISAVESMDFPPSTTLESFVANRNVIVTIPTTFLNLFDSANKTITVAIQGLKFDLYFLSADRRLTNCEEKHAALLTFPSPESQYQMEKIFNILGPLTHGDSVKLRKLQDVLKREMEKVLKNHTPAVNQTNPADHMYRILSLRSHPYRTDRETTRANSEGWKEGKYIAVAKPHPPLTPKRNSLNTQNPPSRSLESQVASQSQGGSLSNANGAGGNHHSQSNFLTFLPEGIRHLVNPCPKAIPIYPSNCELKFGAYSDVSPRQTLTVENNISIPNSMHSQKQKPLLSHLQYTPLNSQYYQRHIPNIIQKNSSYTPQINNAQLPPGYYETISTTTPLRSKSVLPQWLPPPSRMANNPQSSSNSITGYMEPRTTFTLQPLNSISPSGYFDGRTASAQPLNSISTSGYFDGRTASAQQASSANMMSGYIQSTPSTLPEIPLNGSILEIPNSSSQNYNALNATMMNIMNYPNTPATHSNRPLLYKPQNSVYRTGSGILQKRNSQWNSISNQSPVNSSTTTGMTSSRVFNHSDDAFLSSNQRSFDNNLQLTTQNVTVRPENEDKKKSLNQTNKNQPAKVQSLTGTNSCGKPTFEYPDLPNNYTQIKFYTRNTGEAEQSNNGHTPSTAPPSTVSEKVEDTTSPTVQRLLQCQNIQQYESDKTENNILITDEDVYQLDSSITTSSSDDSESLIIDEHLRKSKKSKIVRSDHPYSNPELSCYTPNHSYSISHTYTNPHYSYYNPGDSYSNVGQSYLRPEHFNMAMQQVSNRTMPSLHAQLSTAELDSLTNQEVAELIVNQSGHFLSFVFKNH